MCDTECISEFSKCNTPVNALSARIVAARCARAGKGRKSHLNAIVNMLIYAVHWIVSVICILAQHAPGRSVLVCFGVTALDQAEAMPEATGVSLLAACDPSACPIPLFMAQMAA